MWLCVPRTTYVCHEPHMCCEPYMCPEPYMWVMWFIHGVMWSTNVMCDIDSFTCKILTWLIRVWCDSFICVLCTIYVCDVIYSCDVCHWLSLHARYDSFMYDVTHVYMYHEPYTCVTWFIQGVMWSTNVMCDIDSAHMHDTTHSCMMWLMHICTMNHTHVWHDSSMWCVTLTLSHARYDSFKYDLNRAYVRHKLFARVTWFNNVRCDIVSFTCKIWLIHAWCDSCICVT